MSCVYPPSPATARHATSLWATRLAGEWQLLQALAALNPQRIADLRHDDSTFRLTLIDVPALGLDGTIKRDQSLRIEFPVYFPAVPMEMYLDTPMQHPNIHPHTGFVCLWERHRATHTTEIALHKAVAMLTWKLHNASAIHIMQPAALALIQEHGDAIRAQLECPPLMGLTHAAMPLTEAEMPRRRRLS